MLVMNKNVIYSIKFVFLIIIKNVLVFYSSSFKDVVFACFKLIKSFIVAFMIYLFGINGMLNNFHACLLFIAIYGIVKLNQSFL